MMSHKIGTQLLMLPVISGLQATDSSLDARVTALEQNNNNGKSRIRSTFKIIFRMWHFACLQGWKFRNSVEKEEMV